MEELKIKFGQWYKLRFKNTPEGDAEGLTDLEMIAECLEVKDNYAVFGNGFEEVELFKHEDGIWRDENNWTILKSWEEIE